MLERTMTSAFRGRRNCGDGSRCEDCRRIAVSISNRSASSRNSSLWVGVIMIVMALLVAPLAAAAQSVGKKTINSEADLPQFYYPVTGTAEALLISDPATFDVLARRVRHDLESILRDYEIRDHGVLLHLLSAEVDLQMLFGDDAEALKTCEQMRGLFDRPDMKATGMFNDLSFLRARIATGQSNSEAFQLEYEKDFRSLVESLPWDVVAERIRKRKARFEKLNAEYVETQVETEIEPFVTKNHALDFAMATRLIFWRGTLLTEVPQRKIVLDILSTYIEEHDPSKHQ
jgi:hypothetical protein